jgi:hypothetical protein
MAKLPSTSLSSVPFSPIDQDDIDSYDWFHMLKASVAIKSDLPQKGCDFLRQTAKTKLVKSVFFGRKSELVTGVADVAFGEREDLGRLDGEHENRI